MEKQILSALLHRKTYEKLSPHIAAGSDFSPPAALVYAEIAAWFCADPASELCDIPILSARLLRKLPDGALRELLQDFVSRLDVDISVPNIEGAWIAQKQDAAHGRLLAAMSASPPPAAEIAAAVQDYQTWVGMSSLQAAQPSYTVHDLLPVSTLQVVTDASARVPLLPLAVSEHTGGGALPGNVCLVFARPEVGKTAFALNLARGVARAGKRVLYLGNEDPIVESILPRAWSCFSGMPWGTTASVMERTALEQGIGNVTFVSMWPGTAGQVRELVEKHAPTLTIVDQVGNLGIRGDSYPLQLGQLMREMRSIAKKSGTVLAAFHQAGDSAQDKLLLELGDVSWSNTDMAAQADLMIGIGCNPDYATRGLRMLTFCKNKITGWHGNFMVEINDKTSQFHSIDRSNRS